MWATPLQCIHCMHGTKVGEQLGDYIPSGGFVVTDQGRKVFCQGGVLGAQERFSSREVYCLPSYRPTVGIQNDLSQ